ncbi:MAG: bifunctional metallophosphatase/5'-nucleotidase [Calditrichaeota bacterium]|nr:MAG: bifunctional metallophosphatase/5'-nucleotidase [Calditrichota bacterium]
MKYLTRWRAIAGWLWMATLALNAADKADNRKLYILYTNDVHGGIVETEATFLNPNFPPVLGGGASAAAIIKNVRERAQKEGAAVLLLDAGDIFQGTPLGTRTGGTAIIDYMNAVGYDAVSAGNHDFDLGKDNLARLVERARFPILSANIIEKETGKPWRYVKPWTLLDKQGIKIGIFGLTTEATKNMSFAEHIKGLDFTDESPAAQRAVDTLRAMGADIVIGLVHMGLPYNTEEGWRQLQEEIRQNIHKTSYLNAMELAHYVKGIDILMGGHIHKGYPQPWVDPENHTICFQNYGNGGNLGMAEILIDKATHTIAGYELPSDNSGLLLLTTDEYWPDPEMAALIRKRQAEVEKGFDEVIGVTEQALTRAQGESPMNNLICDAMLEASGADFAFTNFGGIRSDLPIGPITPRDIFRVLPFGNAIVVLKIRGAMLRGLIERKVRGNRSGMAIGGGRVVYKRNAPDGQKIVSFTINGKPLDDNAWYKVATTDYLAEGNSGLDALAEVPEERIDRTGIILREAVTEYVRNHSPLKIKTDGRWVKQ